MKYNIFTHSLQPMRPRSATTMVVIPVHHDPKRKLWKNEYVIDPKQSYQCDTLDDERSDKHTLQAE